VGIPVRILTDDFAHSRSVYLARGRRALFLHPALVFSIVWLGVSLLYSLHLSAILQYSATEAFTVAAHLWLPFAIVALGYSFMHHLVELTHPARKRDRDPDLALLERRLKIWFRVWIAISLMEIAVSGGLPLIWLITRSSKTYMDFGITSVHGLVNSLLISIALCRLALFLITGRRRHLLIPAFALVWSVLAVTRNLMIVSLLEFAVLFLQMRPIKAATAIKFIAVLLCLILVFGIVGDFRQGSSDAILLLAQPTDNYPEWLPSGVLWAYIYITTPINNLIYNMHVTHPVDSIAFPNTVATLFPTVLRIAVYGSHLSDTESGQLVDSAFNVSTAYIGPYEDYGIAGMALFSMFIAFLSQLFWYRRSLQSVLMFAVVMQCLVLTLFFNHFFALPIISQLAWLAYFFVPEGRIGVARRGAGSTTISRNGNRTACDEGTRRTEADE
jgi:oligosaccharide repeat unit polymerase